MNLEGESIRFKIDLADSKEIKRKAVVDFLYPLKEKLKDDIKGLSYFFEPHLQLDVRVNEENRETVQKRIEKLIDTTNDFELKEEVDPNPNRAGWGKSDQDTEALILGHELSAELAMTILNIKTNCTGRKLDEHAERRLHLFLNQMGFSRLEEANIHRRQLKSS